jgi:hypothetical protein
LLTNFSPPRKTKSDLAVQTESKSLTLSYQDLPTFTPKDKPPVSLNQQVQRSIRWRLTTRLNNSYLGKNHPDAGVVFLFGKKVTT